MVRSEKSQETELGGLLERGEWCGWKQRPLEESVLEAACSTGAGAQQNAWWHQHNTTHQCYKVLTPLLKLLIIHISSYFILLLMLRSLLTSISLQRKMPSTEGCSWLGQKPGTWTSGSTAHCLLHSPCFQKAWLIKSLCTKARETWKLTEEAAFPRDGKILIPMPCPRGPLLVIINCSIYFWVSASFLYIRLKISS